MQENSFAGESELVSPASLTDRPELLSHLTPNSKFIQRDLCFPLCSLQPCRALIPYSLPIPPGDRTKKKDPPMIKIGTHFFRIQMKWTPQDMHFAVTRQMCVSCHCCTLSLSLFFFIWYKKGPSHERGRKGVRCMRMSFARYFKDDHDAYSGLGQACTVSLSLSLLIS